MNLLESEQKSAEYRALNPQGFVPMLEIDGHRLTQSVAIINYLDLRYAMQPLLPASAAERAHVVAMAMAVACDIHPLNNLRVLKYLKTSSAIRRKRSIPGTLTGLAKACRRSKPWLRLKPANSCSAIVRRAPTFA